MAVRVCANRRTRGETGWDLFLSEKGLLCKTCCEAKVASEFSEGKVWTKWKLYYLKRHIQQKSHLNAVGIVRRCKMGTGLAENGDAELRWHLSNARKQHLWQHPPVWHCCQTGGIQLHPTTSLAFLISLLSLLASATLSLLPQHTTANRKALATSDGILDSFYWVEFIWDTH